MAPVGVQPLLAPQEVGTQRRRRSGSGPRRAWRAAGCTSSDTTRGSPGTSSWGGTGTWAMCACTSSSGSVAVKGRRPGEELVEGDAQRVEVGARVEGPVHAPGLLGRHVGQRALQHPGRRLRGQLALQFRRDPEVDELERVRLGVVEDVGGVDVLVDDAPLVHVPERPRQPRADPQRPAQVARPPLEEVRQRLAPEVLQHERDPVLGFHQLERLDDPFRARLLRQPVLVPCPGDLLARGVVRAHALEHDRQGVRLPEGAVDE